MARFGFPTVLGASAAGAYGMQQLKESGPVGVWSLLPGSSWGSSGSGSSSGEISALQNELRRLTGVVGDVARNGNRPTVVTVGGKSGWSVLIVPAMVGGTVLYVYCRFTGTSVFDLFYVSRSSLTAFRATVQESMGKMWEELKKSKEEIFKVVTSLGHKQDQMKESQDQLMAKQDQMDDRLRRVDDTCYQLDSKANTTIDRVEKLDNRLQDVHTGVQAANQGIYMLVSAVSEVTQKIGLHNSRTAQALHRFVSNGPAWSNATALPDISTDGPMGSSASMPQLPAPLSLPSGPSISGPSVGGVATPGGLRGLMSGGGAPQPVAHTKPMVTEQVKYGAPVDGASCQIEEVAESKVPAPVVAAAPAKPMMASGLSGMLRGF